MPRPTIDRLFDHTARVWRADADQDIYGSETKDYALVATIGCAINRAVIPVAPNGGGEAPTGRIRMYFAPDADIAVRDVIEIVTGPDSVETSHRQYEVDQPPVRPRNHHTQVDAVAFNGELPTVETS